MIILIGGEKGGTGKSTLAVNLSTLHASRKFDVLLVDADKQASTTKWAQMRLEAAKESSLVRVPSIQKQGKGIGVEVVDLASRYADIIIDTGGRDSIELRAAMAVADVAIIPFQPSQFDMWSAETVSELVEMAKGLNPKLRVMALLSKASTNPAVKEYMEAKDYLATFPNLPLMETVVKDRIGWRRCISEGRSLFEVGIPDQKAVEELFGVYRELFENKSDKM